jgi:hypothetical protein
MIIPSITEQDRIEFWNRVHQPKDGCWPWSGSRTTYNYGVVCYQRRSYGAHIIAYYLTNNIWPGDKQILHTCDNPPCCRPNHLFDGTQQENIDDCSSKERNKGKLPGGQNQSLIDQSDADEIRRLRAFGITAKEIAAMPRFRNRIGIAGIYNIANNRTWKPKI